MEWVCDIWAGLRQVLQGKVNAEGAGVLSNGLSDYATKGYGTATCVCSRVIWIYLPAPAVERILNHGGSGMEGEKSKVVWRRIRGICDYGRMSICPLVG
jgi:hypothetical protein